MELVDPPPPKKKIHTHTYIYIYICSTKITLKHIHNKCEVIFLHKLHFLTEKVPLSRHMFDLCFECQPDLNRKFNNLMRWQLRSLHTIWLVRKCMVVLNKQEGPPVTPSGGLRPFGAPGQWHQEDPNLPRHATPRAIQKSMDEWK